MKATEIQIGDWVQIIEPCKYAGAIGRIKTLVDHKDDENAYFKVFLQNYTMYIGVEDICSDDIKPIPLKKLHLAKNGFKPTDETDMRFVYRDGYEICVIFDDTFKERGIPPCIILRINFAEKTIIMPIEYVHELQHAMRIMGCDKEIKL